MPLPVIVAEGILFFMCLVSCTNEVNVNFFLCCFLAVNDWCKTLQCLLFTNCMFILNVYFGSLKCK